MNTALLDRPRSAALDVDGGGRRRVLLAIVRRLEAWLPAQEAALQRARAANRPLLRREAEWRELVRLYERLCTAVGRG